MHGAFVDATTDPRILTLVVLANDQHVDVGGRLARQRTDHARQQPNRAEIDVLLEVPTNRDQEPPQRDMVGHARPADSAQQDRISGAEQFEPVGGHHRPGVGITLAAPRVLLPLESNVESAAGALEHVDRGRDDLAADPVAGDQRDVAGAQWSSPGRSETNRTPYLAAS